MNYHICIIADHVDEKGQKTEGLEIFKSLMAKNVWGLHPNTASRAKLREGDILVFYLGGLSGRRQVFLGTASVTSPAHLDKTGESDQWFLNAGTYRVDLENVAVWDRAKPIRPLLKKLSFIKNVAHWGPYLQGGVRKIDKADYETIIESEDYSDIIDEEESGIAQFLERFDLSKYSFDPHSLPAPERIRLHELIDNIEDKWKIPNFQRYFDWKKEDVREFLESIFLDYYVGAFLLWKTEKESPLDLIPIKGVKDSSKDTEYIILDGQQRMTALHYAVRAPDFSLGNSHSRSYFYINFRKFLEQENPETIIEIRDELLNETESFEQLSFPFSEIENYDEWINGLEDYLLSEDLGAPHEQVRSLRRIIEKRLKHIWREFEVPYVVLPKTLKLPQVADIFERINTKGKQLSTFDLLIARLLKYGIQLRKLWESVEKSKSEIKKYAKQSEKMKVYVFQTISLLNHPSSSAKREDILNIYENLSLATSEEFTELWNTSVEAINDAIKLLENLRSGFGVRKENEVPFSPMIPALAALVVTASKKENKADCHKKIQQWYWSAVFTNAYSSGADTQMTADYIDMSLWFDDDAQVPRVVLEARRDINTLSLRGISSSGNAVYKGVLSLVALEGANDFEKNQSLELARSNDKDHIFPKASSSGFAKHKHLESVLNMTWLSKDTNIRKKAKRPSEYIPEFVKEKYSGNAEEFKKVLATHFIDENAYNALVKDEFDAFLDTREKNIKKKVRDLLGVERTVGDSIEENPGEAVDELESKIREYINRKLTSEVGVNYWDSVVTSGVKQRTKEKVAQRNKRQPTTANEKLSGLSLLSFCDVMDYSEIILANWAVFENDFGSKREVEKHFLHLKDYRNAIKHNREMNNVERKQGEASSEWIFMVVGNGS